MNPSSIQGEPRDAWPEPLARALKDLEKNHLRRARRVLGSRQTPEANVNGAPLTNFSSNDYLGLASDPRLTSAAMEALKRFGTGSGASRLVCGTLSPHAELEERLAQFKRTEAVLTFSSGYATATGTLPALAAAGDVIILDKLAHASLIDGARLSGAVLRVFPHNDLDRLESHLQWARKRHPNGRILIVTESVFSMDGDLAPLREIVELKDRWGAWLFVDEAHGVGVRGVQGRGLADELGISGRIEIQMGTLGKALGSAGGYIAGSRVLVEYLYNKARSFVFSTAPPPAQTAAASAALQILESGDGEKLRDRLWKNISLLHEALSRIHQAAAPQSAILPLITGKAETAVALSEALQERGFLIPAIRWPTVPRDAARIRIAVSAAHTPEMIRQLGAALHECTGSSGYEPKPAE
jgi:8-amino-7-oxononanoate synthase